MRGPGTTGRLTKELTMKNVIIIAAILCGTANADELLTTCEGKSAVMVKGDNISVTDEGLPPVSDGLLGGLGYKPVPGSDMPASTVGDATGPGSATTTKAGNGPAEVSTENLDKPHGSLTGIELTQWNQFCEGRSAADVSEWRKGKCRSLDPSF